MRIHHIGYLVKNIEKSQKLFKSLGYETEAEPVYDAHRKIEICFMQKDGYRIELVSPVSDESVVSPLRKKIGNSPYHICYEAENLEKAVEELKKQHFVICEEPHIAVALQNREVIFMIHGQMGMIELVEKRK